jgi:hypothetical protein
MNPLAQLRDIQGLDRISRWPLALGWWILFALILVLLTSTIAFYFIRRKYKARWQYQLLQRLEQMESRLNPEQSQTLATELAQLLRRVAVHRYSRSECAQLYGKEWLAWMTQKDPQQFDWSQSANVLTQAPFQPQGTVIDQESLQKTIRAAKAWVR